MTKPMNKILLLSHYFAHSYTTNPHTEGQAIILSKARQTSTLAGCSTTKCFM